MNGLNGKARTQKTLRTLSLAPHIDQALRAEARRRRTSISGVAEQIFAEALLPEYADDREAVITKRLTSIDYELDQFREESRDQFVVLMEAVTGFLRVFMARVPEPVSDSVHGRGTREAVRKQFEVFLETLARRVQVGETAVNRLTQMAPETQDAEASNADPSPSTSER